MKVSRYLFLSALLSIAAGKLAAEISAVPHPTAPIDAKRTVVWSPLFQATWDQIKTETGPLLSVSPENEMISRLEAFKWNAAATMPGGSWKTWSGPATPEFLATVNREAAALAGDPEGPFRIDDNPPPGRLMAFGLLDHEVEFFRELARAKSIPLKFQAEGQETEVCFFGARDEHPAIRVLSWQPAERSHAVQIRCKDADDSVILYLPSAASDFGTASLKIRAMLERKEADIPESELVQYLYKGDQIRIPYLTLESKAEFSGQLGGLIDFERMKGMTIIQASQLTRFKLHEKSARVRSETTNAADPFGGPPEPKPPRAFLYDRPFFVFMWKKDAAWPYFGAWIGDSAGMELWTGPAKD
ncbi:MAG: hypothetical protein KF712_07065 [Akkermansiaceae bacterium]|nr:hypothetical protein [Akkermansiaceae bacterium]